MLFSRTALWSRFGDIRRRLDASEEAAVRGLVVENGTAIERGRDFVFVGNSCVKVRFGCKLCLYRPSEAFKATEAVKFLFVPNLCSIERGSEEVKGFVVGLDGNREWMTILATVRE